MGGPRLQAAARQGKLLHLVLVLVLVPFLGSHDPDKMEGYFQPLSYPGELNEVPPSLANMVNECVPLQHGMFGQDRAR